MNLTAPGQRRRWKTVLVVVLAHLIAILAAGLLFLSYRVYSHHRTYASRTTFWLGNVHEDSEEIGFVLAPNRQGLTVLHHGLEDAGRRIPMRTDQFGFRVPLDRESTQIETGGIASIGCSCTFGYGIAAESTFVYLAGEEMQLPAFNLGVCSYSAVTSIEILRQHIETLRPSYVVYGFGNFHFGRSVIPRTDGVLFQTYLTEEATEAVRIKPHLDNKGAFGAIPGIEEHYYRPKLEGRNTYFSWARFRVVLPLAWQDLKRLRHPEYLKLRFLKNELTAEVYANWVVEELVSVCRSVGAKATILYLPAFYGERPMPELLQALEAYADADDVLFVDSSVGLFEGIANQEEYAARYQVPRDGHPNRFMHLEMARALRHAYGDAGWLSR